jgi:hypothetical protein
MECLNFTNSQSFANHDACCTYGARKRRIICRKCHPTDKQRKETAHDTVPVCITDYVRTFIRVLKLCYGRHFLRQYTRFAQNRFDGYWIALKRQCDVLEAL